ncbi:MAG TPA: acyltransferase [Spirochaetota bacterium]|nr:acyltransferase [Spirochaetota bacterium]HPC43193.1 acyltransferase [Spirochaetota bacterium]HPL15470.1 acyltransferase [Spirochaetota bacterium]HQF10484.1 acyltransferase [Spirochaetota bacterium]HQH99478.1 acyltransferase [Spirochaetota bacterium]
MKQKESILLTIGYNLRGLLSMLLLYANTLILFGPLMTVAILKLIIPISGWRKLCGIVINGIAVTWISINNINLGWTQRAKWVIRGLEGLSLDEWYLVISNHQTWVDIVVLQRVFNRKIPFLKFFLKKELVWVPFLGIAWWALDYPFMKRYSPAFLKKNPHLKGKDIEITRKACRKFKGIPVSIMNFVEGTRFTKEKHDQQKSPFKHLLKPKAGGIGFVLSTMGEQLSSILNVTIVYPDGDTSFWHFICGRIKEIRVIIEKMPVTPELLGDYVEDKDFQNWFQGWLNGIWTKKDKLLDEQ